MEGVMAGKFKDFGKKIGQAAKNTAKKSEELIEIQKVKGKIKDHETSVYGFIKQIGEIALEKHENGEKTFDEADELCKQIEEARESIKGLEAEILELRHIRVCPSCGKENDDEVVFCPKCGFKYEPKPEPEPEPKEGTEEGNKCKKCGEPLEEDTAFCPNCGEKVD